MIRLSLSSALLSVLLVTACATAPTGRPPQPPSSPSVQAELGYREVLQAGEEYARQQGYAVAGLQEAVEVRPNYWRLRFGLAERHTGKLLDLEFDGASQQVVREEIISEPAVPPSP
ncbi:MAG: hypothetical protein JXB05_28400 [Myxococcaceae bacterium]|nr:hypothetical protein [Myxococcaceae bacterium]